jgi:hypothetical protein
MTTFGGQTIPPLFGGVAADGIFIRSVGAPYFQPSNVALAATNLGLPATRNPGDLLYVYSIQYSGGIPPQAPTAVEWTTAGFGGGGINTSFRTATNDALDNYLVPAISNISLGMQFFAQMVCLASSDPAKSVVEFLADEGTESSFNTDTMPLAAIGAGGDPTNTFVIGFYGHWYGQAFSTLMPTSQSDAAGLTLIGKGDMGASRIDTPATTFHYLVAGWGSVYQATSAALALQNIPFLTPFVIGSAQVRSQYRRFRAV